MDETEAWVGTITESGLSTTMVGMIPGLVVWPGVTESRSGGWESTAWNWTPTEGTGEAGVDNPAGGRSLTVAASAGEYWGEGGRPASTVSQWKGSPYTLLVVLSSAEKSDAGLAV